MKLRRVAHARSGDKGDISNIAVIARDERDYDWIARHVTIERVRAQLGGLPIASIDRYELPSIGALNFVLKGALAGGVTRSIALDAHGKSLSSALLDMDLPDRETA